MGAPNLIADTMDCGLSYSVISYLKKLSQQVKTHETEHISEQRHRRASSSKKHNMGRKLAGQGNT